MNESLTERTQEPLERMIDELPLTGLERKDLRIAISRWGEARYQEGWDTGGARGREIVARR